MRRILFLASTAMLGAPTLADAQTDDVVVLDTIMIQGGYEEARGPFEGYLAGLTATATKAGTPLAEVPQSISVIGRAEMDARSATRLSEVLRYAPGVTVEVDGVDSRFDSISVRGFNTDNATWLDGLAYPAGGGAGNNWTIPQIDTFTLERVEVLKGPSSSLYGQLPPGGMVNQISKRPSDVPAGIDEYVLDSFGKVTVALDRTGPLNDRVKYRIIAKAGETGARISEGDRSRILIAPSLSLDLGEGQLTFHGQWQRDRGGIEYSWLPAEGTLFDNPNGQIPRDFFAGEPGFNRYDRDQTILGYEYETPLTEGLVLRHALRWSRVKSVIEMMQSDMYDDPDRGWDGRTLDRYAVKAWGDVRTITSDTSLNWDVDVGAVRHQVVAGFDVMDSRFDATRLSGTGPSLDLFDPVYGNGSIGNFELTSRIKAHLRQIGIYAQDHVEWGNWRIQVGLRHDRARTESDITNRRGSSTVDQDDSATSGRLGILYRFDNGMAPYVSYGTSFQPVTGATFEGEPFKPTRGKQIELGMRYAPANDLLWTAALFDIRQTNRLTDDPVNGYPDQVQTGEVRIRGIETELKADLQNGWSITAGYMRLDHEVTESTIPEELGRPLLFVPRSQASLWADYTVPGGVFADWRFGAGLRHIGQSRGGDIETATGYAGIRIPGVTLLDARVSMPLDSWKPGAELNLSVSNATDKSYVAGCGSLWTCGYGYGRTATLSLTTRF